MSRQVATEGVMEAVKLANDGLTNSEIADALGISAKAAERRLHGARALGVFVNKRKQGRTMRRKYDWASVWELQGEGMTEYQISQRLGYPLTAVQRIVAMSDETPDDDEPTAAVERCPHCLLTLPHYDCISKNVADYVSYGMADSYADPSPRRNRLGTV